MHKVFTISFILTLLVFSSVYAETSQESGTYGPGYTNQTFDYVLLEPLPGFDGDLVRSEEFASFAQKIINLIIGISAVLAVLMFTIGGFQYLTGETLQMKSDGRSRMANAIIGLLLVLCAYLILYTINPQLVNLNLTIQPITTAGSLQLPIGSQSGPVNTGGTGSTSGSLQGCYDCVPMILATNGNACIPQNGTCYINKDLQTRLAVAQNALGNNAGVISEAGFNTTISHIAGCHTNGTCIDYSIKNDTSPANISRVAAALQAAGLNPEYEVSTLAAKNEIIQQMQKSNLPVPVIRVVPSIRGEHFSVYHPVYGSKGIVPK